MSSMHVFMKFNFFCTYFWKAFCMQNPEAREKGMTVSLFRRLSEAHPQAVSALQCQYRMCADIMSLCNALIYGNRLRCGSHEVATAQLTFSTPLLKHAPQWLHQVCNFVHKAMNPNVTDQCMISVSDLTLIHWDSYCAIVTVVQVLDPCRKVLFLDTGKLKKLNFLPIVFYTHVTSCLQADLNFILFLFYLNFFGPVGFRCDGCWGNTDAQGDTQCGRGFNCHQSEPAISSDRESLQSYSCREFFSLSFLSNLMSLEWLGGPHSVQVFCFHL